MSRLFESILLPLLLAPSVSVAQTPDSMVKGQRVRVVSRCEVASDQAPVCREGGPLRIYTGQLETLDGGNLHIRAQSNNAELVIPTASVTRLSIREGTRGHFWAGAGIGLLGGDDIEERADLTFCQHIVVLGATGAGTRGLAGGILNELTDLFFQGHLLQQVFNTWLNGRIIPFGSGLRCGVCGGCGLG